MGPMADTVTLPAEDQIREALTGVIDPELKRSVVELGMVRSIDIAETGHVAVKISLTTGGCPLKGSFTTDVNDRVGSVEGVSSVDVTFDVLSPEEKDALKKKLGMPGGLPTGALATIGQILCIGSGKGGVGKSSLTSNLAVALVREGKSVGILDADVWGYSIP